MKTKTILACFLIIGSILVGCNFPSDNVDTDQDNDDLTIILTAAVETLQAQDNPGLPSAIPASTNVAINPSESPFPTATAFPTATSTQTIPCDRAAFVSDVTVPDGEDYSANETFTKTWRLRNSGSCTWTTEYALVFDSGNSMSGPSAVQLTSAVSPNQTIDISVDLTAPNNSDTYRGNWKLRNADGVVFGLGNAGSAFYVEIDVVSSADFSIAFDNLHDCGGLVYATVKITNVGVEFLQSARIKVEDVDDSTILYGPSTSNKPFITTPNGCPPGNSDADPTETYYIAVSIGVSPPSGNLVRFTLKLCTLDNLAGTCIEKWVEFELP